MSSITESCSASQLRILFLSAWYPIPANNGSKLRIYNLLRGLSREYDVTLVTLSPRAQGDGCSDLSGLCTTSRVVPYSAYNPHSLRSLIGFLSPMPRVLVDTYSPAMEDAIRHALDIGAYDLVITSEWPMTAYQTMWHGLPAILEDVEVGYFVDAVKKAPTGRSRLRSRLTASKFTYYLRRTLPGFKAATVVSPLERVYLQELVPHYRRIEIVPNCVSVGDYADVDASPQQATFVFAGSLSYSANYEAMVWFLEDVFPLIRNQVPNARIIITGDHRNLPLPATDGVTLTGLVDDVRPIIASAWVSLAPILSGGGTRLKILEAMALRTPVVATSKGAEGLEARNGEHLLIADTPHEFADAVVRLCGDVALRTRLADNGYQLVREEYDWDAVMPRFLRLVEAAAHA